MGILFINFGILVLIVLAWVYLFFVFLGIGYFVRCLWGLLIRSREDILFAFWIGWAHAIFLLLAWNFFWPIDGRAFVVVSALGLTGSWQALRNCPVFLDSKVFRPGYCGIILAIGFWLAFRLTTGSWNYDSGLYYVPTIHWLSSFPVIPGLANLHGRLAYNCAYFLYAAMLEMNSGNFKLCALANGLLLWAFFAEIILSWFKIFQQKGPVKLPDVFCGLLIVPALMLRNIFSPSPDIALILLVMLTSLYYLRFLSAGGWAAREKECQIYFIVMVVALGIIVKLNFLIFGLSVMSLTYWHLWRSTIKSRHRWNAGFCKIGVAFFGIMFFWMWRGIILSGYVLFPSPWLSLPVPWRVPQASVVNLANWIYAWPRQHQVRHWSHVLGHWNWLGEWFARVSAEPAVLIIPLLLSVASIGFIIYIKFGKKPPVNISKKFWLFIAPAFCALVAWFLLAPEPRYGSIFAWVLAMGCLAFLMTLPPEGQELKAVDERISPPVNVPAIWSSRCFSDTKLKFILLICFLFVLLKFPSLNRRNDSLTTENFRRNAVTPGSEWLRYGQQITHWPDLPKGIFKTYISRSGLIVTVPVKGDQCWDAALPCTPYPHPHLRLRNPGQLDAGFVVDPRNEKDASVGMHEEWEP